MAQVDAPQALRRTPLHRTHAALGAKLVPFAGYGAKKLGGGCFSTVLIFILLWWLLGQCGGPFQ